VTANTTDFAQMVTEYLTDYLPLQRNYSRNTVCSYKDALKLFLRFLIEAKQINWSAFKMKDFNRKLVIEFLEWLRTNGSSTVTTNQRLAALKSFADYAGIENIEYLSNMQNVMTIKQAKTVVKEIKYLTVEQISKLVNLPDINKDVGLRHRVVLTLLYDSGCRVQELCDIKIRDINLGNNPTVRLHGKGGKYRTIVISKNTGKLISEYISRQRRYTPEDGPLIINRSREKISRDGVSYIVEKYVSQIRKDDPSFPDHIHPHVFRHSKAMHMLAAGINIVYIRDFLGHEDISTTMVYAKADNRLKIEAINKLAPRVAEDTVFADWSQNQDLLDFLNSFK